MALASDTTQGLAEGKEPRGPQPPCNPPERGAPLRASGGRGPRARLPPPTPSPSGPGTGASARGGFPLTGASSRGKGLPRKTSVVCRGLWGRRPFRPRRPEVRGPLGGGR